MRPVDAFNVCEWGAINDRRGGPAPGWMILGFRESVTAMGIVTRKDTALPGRGVRRVPLAVQEHTGSHYIGIRDDGRLRPAATRSK